MSTPEFSVILSDGPGPWTVVAVMGEIDLLTAPGLIDAVEDQLARGPVLLDLGAVEFLDSSGVRALDRILRLGDEPDNELAIRPGLRPNVEQVLALTGLLDVLPLHEASRREGP